LTCVTQDNNSFFQYWSCSPPSHYLSIHCCSSFRTLL